MNNRSRDIVAPSSDYSNEPLYLVSGIQSLSLETRILHKLNAVSALGILPVPHLLSFLRLFVAGFCIVTRFCPSKSVQVFLINVSQANFTICWPSLCPSLIPFQFCSALPYMSLFDLVLASARLFVCCCFVVVSSFALLWPMMRCSILSLFIVVSSFDQA